MTKDEVLHLRYLGAIPQVGHCEYGFRIEDKDKSFRQVVLTIDSGLFLKSQLMFQEAPDLCYQKVLTDLSNETPDAPVNLRMSVTESDVAHYRDSHPNVKSRNKSYKKRLEEAQG